MAATKTSMCSALLMLTAVSHAGRGNFGFNNPGRPSRCGESPSATETVNYGLLSRIVGGTTANKNDHPWVVSLRRDGKHFCGGTIVSDKYILTAAHCVSERNVELKVKVFVGDHDLTIKESTEKVFYIKAVTKHPNFNPNRPINYDIAVVEVEGRITFDEKIQPACLPNPDDILSQGTLCTALGWGRLQENGQLASRLQKVELPLIEYKRCLSAVGGLDRRLVFETVICAGFPEGGKDACQGDSGGPFLCQRGPGRWVLVGVTSWGMGCARKWDNNWKQVPAKRGSPGVFTDIQRLLNWVNANLNQVHCSTDDGLLSETAGEILLPKAPKNYYSNNEKCMWTIRAPKGKQILLTFTHFDLEWDYSCDLDYLAIYSTGERLIGKFCGDVRPRPMLISDTNITLKFISDFQEYRSGFALSYLAIEPNTYPDSECGSVAVIFEEGEIQTMNHPKAYSSQANCQWVVHCPKYYIIKITFLAFELELSEGCIFDHLVVYNDLAGAVVAGKFCGFSLPDPILSTSNVMQIKFISDSSGNYIGFRAAISFVPSSTFIPSGTYWNSQPRQTQNSMEHFDKVCGASPVPPRFIYRSIDVAEEAIPNSWPWHVSINFGNKHVCNGVIVSEAFVLTSANCIAARGEFRDVWLVVAGVYDLELSENTQKPLVKQVIVHPGFSPLSMDFDIALIQLEKRLQFNLYVQPICLPKAHSKVEPSDLCVVSGWNLNGNEKKSTKLQQLEVPVLLDDVCKDYYNFMTDRMFCAGSATGKASNTCSEQSGSPLVCLSDDAGIYFIFGIVSWGVGCKENPKPGVFSRIPLFIEWIEEMMLSVEELKKTEPQYPFIRTDDEDQLGQLASLEKALQPDNAPSNDSSSSQNIYVACKDVVSLQSPGEIKLVANSQDNAKGFRCQLIFQAPKDYFIMLNFKQLNMSRDHNSLVIYEGISSNKTFKAQLTEDKIPSTITSMGPALTVEATTAHENAELRLWLSYTFHNQN